MSYQEFPPPAGLAGLVDCFWRSESAPGPANGPAAPPVSHRVLPDNRTDILWQDSGAAFFVGMMSTWFDVPAERRVRTVAVRFRAGAAGLFLGGLPLDGLRDGRADLDQLWGRSEAERLGDALWSVARNDAERLALLADALYARLALASPGARAATALATSLASRAGTAPVPGAASSPGSALLPGLAPSPGTGLLAPAVARSGASNVPARRGLPQAVGAPGQALALRAVSMLEASGGALRVEELAAALGVSRQYLATQFRDHVGLPPKLFARICRFRSARAAALAASAATASPYGRDWASLALDSGYFDQSHLIRDFHDFTGTSPDIYVGKG